MEQSVESRCFGDGDGGGGGGRDGSVGKAPGVLSLSARGGCGNVAAGDVVELMNMNRGAPCVWERVRAWR